MKAAFNARQLGHRPPDIYMDGQMIAYPDSIERTKALLKGAQLSGLTLYAAKSSNEDIIGKVHPAHYLNFIKSAFDDFSQIVDEPEVFLPALRLLKAIKTSDYNVITKASMHMNGICPIVKDTWLTAKASADTALTAARFIIDGDKYSYAICRPPGHMAYADIAFHFCYLNNAAIAAQRLLEKFNKVAILDIGVHHGSGTQAIFFNRDDVYTVSIHTNPVGFFPYFSGHETEKGEGEGAGFNLNIPLPRQGEDTFWLAAVEQALNNIGKKQCDVIVLSLGLDIHESDPVKGAAVSSEGLIQIARMIAEFGTPVLIVQEEASMTPFLSENLADFLYEFVE